MNRKQLGWLASLALVLCAASGAILMLGCEDGSAGTHALTVEPAYVDLRTPFPTNSTQNQTFTVTDGTRELSLPLTWTVSDPALGRIGSHGGMSAAYVRTSAAGDNSIVVKDQYGAEGVAAIRQ